MKLNTYVSLFIVIIMLLSCKFPFDTNSTSDDIFTLTADFDASRRIVDTLTVKLNWDEITLDNFKNIKITRLNENRSTDSYPTGATESGWVTIAVVEDEFVTSWVDTVNDDETFVYRVDYYNSDNNYRRAEAKAIIRPTTHLTIPDDYNDVKMAVESYIIDNGDSVLLKPGEYSTFAFSFLEKRVHLLGIGGARQTLLKHQPTYTESGKLIHDSTFVRMTGGTIQGLTIKDGYAYYGAGVYTSDNSTIKQCIITENKAGIQHNGGLGGGLYLTGNSTISNCIIYNNYADELGGGIYINSNASSVNIINCTVSGNTIFNNSTNVILENTIIDNMYIGIVRSTFLPSVKYSYAGTYFAIQDTTNITGELLFDDYFNLLPGSVCIDTGNPDSAFYDPDGSRNDIGAFGGPLGNWN